MTLIEAQVIRNTAVYSGGGLLVRHKDELKCFSQDGLHGGFVGLCGFDDVGDQAARGALVSCWKIRL